LPEAVAAENLLGLALGGLLQAILVQMSCMGYEFVLLKLCNLQHMRRFSVFLALPSATIRGMTNKPCLVGDVLGQLGSSTNQNPTEKCPCMISAVH
jgi:hypothetical protein